MRVEEAILDTHYNGIKVKVLPFGVHGDDLKAKAIRKRPEGEVYGAYGWRSVTAMARMLAMSPEPIYRAIREGRIESRTFRVNGKTCKYVRSSTRRKDVLKKEA